ncbi:MAG TPA: glycosyltransferase [Chloroflexota bacterium]
MSNKKRRVPAARPRPVLVSACMIVKDEAANLPRCLQSLAGKVDEVVVVDTGSTDSTPEIARAHGAKLVQFRWRDDFAAARNESTRQASGKWLLWVDADEELMEESPGALRRLCEQGSGLHGFLLSCRNLASEDGDIGSEIKQWRLFPNDIGLHFVGRIHEHLQHANGSTDANLGPQDQVWIRHWGYIPEPNRVERKRERNFRLLELALRESPENPFFHYNLGKQYAGEYQSEPALENLERAVALWQEQGRPSFAYVGNMFALAINAAVELGHNQRAVEIEALVPPHLVFADILFQAGVAWWRLGRREESLTRLNRAWQDPAAREGIEGDPTSATWRPLAALAQFHLDMGETDRAYQFALQAYEHGPEMPNIIFALAFISVRQQHYEEGLRWARVLLAGDAEVYKAKARRLLFNLGNGLDDPNLLLEACSGEVEGIASTEVVLAVAGVHGRLGNVQGRYDALDAGCRAHPADSRIRLELAELLEAQGFASEALQTLGQGLDQPEPPPELYKRLALLLAKQGQLEDAAKAAAVFERLTLAAT